MAHDDTVQTLLDAYPRTFAEEAGADPATGRPADLYQLLVVSVLASARISADLATSGARALFDAGLRTPQAMCDAGWTVRTQVLNESGYARYDESTSRMLGDGAELLLDRWDGDLTGLRVEADRDPGREHRLLQEVKGIGPTGADIFCREAQRPWPELQPFVDDAARRGAEAVGLPADGLADVVDADRLPTLVSALVRVSLDDDAARHVREGRQPPPTRTKAALYEAAQDLDVHGRSSMSKDELADAVEAARDDG